MGLAFTPGGQAAQVKCRMSTAADLEPDPSMRREIDFIKRRDSFYLASVMA